MFRTEGTSGPWGNEPPTAVESGKIKLQDYTTQYSLQCKQGYVSSIQCDSADVILHSLQSTIIVERTIAHRPLIKLITPYGVYVL